ncbi:MAG: SCO family protein [Chloroflexi bacterium]|nr:MAG: SCO family protein [Chloroflexota bacterium]
MCSSGHFAAADPRHEAPLAAHILGAMRPACVAIVLAVVACAPLKLVGTDLGATEAPDFTLTDAVSGRSVSLSAQRGQVVALTFLYTTCPDVCPLTASRFRAAQDSLASEAGRVVFIAVSVDPDRDTPKATQDFSAAHGLSANWYYLVGGRAQLAPVWSAYGIGVQAGSASVTHNDAVYLIDRRGRERVLLHSEDLAANLVDDLRSLLRAGD